MPLYKILAEWNASHHHGKTLFEEHLGKIEISDDVISQSISTKFYLFVCNAKKHLSAKFEQDQTRNKEVAKNGKWYHCDVISKIAQQFLYVSSFTHTY